MIGKSESVACYILRHIQHQLQSQINNKRLKSLNQKEHSANSIEQVLEEITDQLLKANDKAMRLKTPDNHDSLRLDSYMSVFNVQNRFGQNNSKLTNNKSSQSHQLEISLKDKIKRKYNKIEALPEPEIPVPTKQEEDEERMHDKLRKYLNEKQAKNQKKEKKEKKIIKNIAINERQKISYDYDCARIKIQNKARNHLVDVDNRIRGTLIPKVQKTKLQRVQKIRTSSLPVILVTAKIKTDNDKKKRSGKLQDTKPQAQQLNVQFSKINTLTEQFYCQKGVSLKFEGRSLSQNKTKTEVSEQKEKEKRYSRLQFLALKTKSRGMSILSSGRSPSSKSQINGYQFSKISNQITPRKNLLGSRKNRDGEKQQMKVENDDMMKYLLEKEPTREISEYTKQQKSSTLKKTEGQFPLDGVDKFNIKYLKGQTGHETSRQSNKVSSNRPSLYLSDFRNYSKVPMLKVREKLSSKKVMVEQLRKRFEESMRSER